MKYFIHGNNKPIQFTNNDFIFKGGEGSIYSKGMTIYKIYNNPKEMIPYEKIDELKVLNHSCVVRPKDLIYNQAKTIVGFTMDKVIGIPLCKLFTNSFRNLNNIKPEIIVKLVNRMIEIIIFIHDKKCLLVDGNEMNYMVDDKTYQIPYFIDVNSYQTPSFPATALMLSIKDFHSNKFSELTDWFSFAIVSCNLFIGLHPFRGRHKNYKPGIDGMLQRMKDNISIFHSGVSLPKTVRDFSYIPSDIRDWYIRLFEKGERIPPPSIVGMVNIKKVETNLIRATNNFDITLVKTFKTNILKYKKVYMDEIIETEDRIFINKLDFIRNSKEGVIISNSSKYMFFNIRDRYLHVSYDSNINYKKTSIIANDFYIYDNTLFTIFDGKVSEISIIDNIKNPIIAIKSCWNIMKNSSKIFDGFIYQNILGKSYLNIIIPELSVSESYDIPIPELDRYYQIIDGKLDNNVCMLIAYDKDKYYKIILRFSGDFKTYDCQEIEVDVALINFVTLKNGITISINSDDSLEIFSSNPNSKHINRIEDPDIDSSFNLCKSGMDVLFFKDNKLFKIKMKGGN